MFIEAQRPYQTIVALCRNLEVSKAGYYAWRGRSASAHDRTDELLSRKIRSIHLSSKQLYGAPNVHAKLRSDGVRVGRKRVARLMKSHALHSVRTKRKRVRTTDSAHNHPVVPNVLNRQFRPLRPDQAWAADITYLPTNEGWLFLAVVLDLYSRRVVGWSMSKTIDATLVLDALRMAIQRRRPPKGLLVHSDRGSQYACREYRKFVAEHGIVASMSRKRNCWDNAVVESFFSTMKAELGLIGSYKTQHEARSAIFQYIEVWYNRQRQHSTIGYLSPAAYERRPYVN